MIKAIKGYKGVVPAQGRPEGNPFADEESGELSLEDDPDLESPAAAKAKEKLKHVLKTIQNPPAPPRTQPYAEPGMSYAAGAGDEYGAAWKFLINILIMGPWSLVLLLSFLVNRWQLLFRPLGGLLWYSIDWLDQRVPNLVDWLLWFVYQVSLVLHVLTVGINLGVIWIMWDNGHHASPFFIVAFYAFTHYCSAVTMFKELDMREAGDTYFSDVLTLFQRCIDVLFYDIQMVASVVHSNRMLEGMTQVAFKGYEEARVALTCLLFTIPCCIIVGVEYGVFMDGKLKTDYRDLKLLTSWQDQLYAAVCFSAINSVEKILRFSLVDPWMHDKNDGFPLLYIRSHAARLPASVVRDWLVRCKVALQMNKGQLVLKELYSHYTQQVKDTCASLADPHKAYLLRKAVHYFNTQRQHRKEATDKPLIEDLVADDISPGLQLSTMLSDILEDTSSLHSLSLANNHLDDTAVANIMRALAANGDVQLTNLDLSGNSILAPGTAAVAAVLSGNHSIYTLSLAGCPLRDEGAMALAEALKVNISLYKLDLSNCLVGPEGAIALAAALKVNPVLSFLNLSGTSIGSLGVEALCKALKAAGSSGLKELDLSHTAADDKAAATLAGLLSSSRVLERLVLTHTNITDAGAQLLCNALQGNSTLQSINVSNNSSMDKSWQKLLNHLVKGKARS